MDRLLGLVGLLHSDLDLPAMLRRISDAAADLLDGEAAGVVQVRSEGLEVSAVAGTGSIAERHFFAYEQSSMEALDLADTDILVTPTADYPAVAALVAASGRALPTMAVARVVVHGQTRGGLYVLFADSARDLDADERLLLELLAGHVGAVLAHHIVVRQRQHGRAILAAMADGVGVVTAAGTVVWWNVAAGTITGVPEREALGQPLPFPVTDHGVEVEHQLADGRWVEAVCSPLVDHDPPETVVTFRDISAAKMVEEAKNVFLATTGHELRTPLTVIRGFASTLITRWDLLTDDERQEAVRIIAARADGLGVLVEQVLASSHAEVGARRLERIPLALGPILATAAVDVGSLSEQHTVTVEVADDLPLVLADEQAVRTVLGHLVDNAVKYSPAGGRVAISAVAADDGSAVCVRVDDEGIGVASEDQERVFERFFQSDGGDTRHRGGFGLGLYIVRRLVQAHGGTVSMGRRPGGLPGSRVELRLPTSMAK
ncbi:hypothetical protein acdb102_15300 [Acidothermaceae bacterium B102]|nr:hypothetical protein acdb102_15300 [Acidothermaceae bacterium B102]